jgi:hypothetical protein
MEVTTSASTEMSRVAVRLPSFCVERPTVWFAQAEAQFNSADIRGEITKLYHVIAQLGHLVSATAKAIHTRLKTEPGVPNKRSARSRAPHDRGDR